MTGAPLPGDGRGRPRVTGPVFRSVFAWVAATLVALVAVVVAVACAALLALAILVAIVRLWGAL